MKIPLNFIFICVFSFLALGASSHDHVGDQDLAEQCSSCIFSGKLNKGLIPPPRTYLVLLEPLEIDCKLFINVDIILERSTYKSNLVRGPPLMS
ncbi:MAG: hypothetical protein ACO20H_12950 [Bacteriovoracaceae bacterium]